MAGNASQYLLLNGNFHNEGSTIFSIGNRGLLFGDCITETIHACASRLCFFDEHLENLREAMKAAQMSIPAKFFNADKEFTLEISKMLTKNRVFKGATIKIMVFRSALSNGPKIPDKVEYVAYVDGLFDNSVVYELNAQGLSIDVYNDFPKSSGVMQGFDTHEDQMLRIAARKKSRLVSDMLLVNSKGHIVESASYGNVFVVKDNVLCTPPIDDGCMRDVMRKKVIAAAKVMDMQVNDKDPLTEDDLKQASEIFMANTALGIQWVIAYKGRRFRRTTAELFSKAINQMYGNEDI